MTREELELAEAHLDATDALIAAKDAYRANPTASTKAARDEAVKAVRELTTHWRGIREALAPGATIPTIEAKVK